MLLHIVKILLNSNVGFQHSCRLLSKVSSTWFISQISTPHYRSGWGRCLAYWSWETPLGYLTQCGFPFWQKPLGAALWVRLCHWFYTYPWVVTSPCFLRLLKRVSQAPVSQILLRVKIYGIYCLSPLPKAHYCHTKKLNWLDTISFWQFNRVCYSSLRTYPFSFLHIVRLFVSIFFLGMEVKLSGL